MTTNIVLIVLVIFILWQFYKNKLFQFKIESLKKENAELIKKNKELIDKSRSGIFFVQLENVDKEKSNLLTTIISIIMDIEKDKAKSMIDSVLLGSMLIVVNNISEDYAMQVKQTIENHGGTVTIHKNK